MRFYLTGPDKLWQLCDLKNLEQDTKYYRYTVYVPGHNFYLNCKDPRICAALLRANQEIAEDSLPYLSVDREGHIRGYGDEDED